MPKVSSATNDVVGLEQEWAGRSMPGPGVEVLVSHGATQGARRRKTERDGDAFDECLCLIGERTGGSAGPRR
jgi:hypothetical protein